MRFSITFRRLTLIAAACLLQGTAVAADTLPGDEMVSLNFANADIESVIAAIGKISGKNFLIDPRVKGTLNVITNTPVSREMSYQILLSALRLQGFSAVEGGGVVKIMPEADAKMHGAPVSKGIPPKSGSELVTQVFQMRNESATQMLSVVRPLVTPNNTVTAFPSNNTLVVTDYADNMVRIGQLIASMDVPQNGVSVIDLQYAVAEDLAHTISKLMSESGSNGNGGEFGNGGSESIKKIQIIPEPRTNSLLVKSDNAASIREVRQLAMSLDRPGAGGNIHVIYLKNAEAEKIAQTLNDALSGNGNMSLDGSSNTNLFSNNTTSSSTSNEKSGDGRTISGLNSSSNTNTGSYNNNGIIKADRLNNALIIVAPDAVYRNIRHVVDLLDRRRVQVYIEALVAEITSEHAAEIGMQWQVGGMLGGGKGALAGTNFGTGTGNLLSAMQNPSNVNEGFNFLIGRGTVKIPMPNGEVVEVFNLGMLANFLESDVRNNILSTPNIVTLDNEEAKIMVGSEVPYPTGQYTSTGSATSTVTPFTTIETKDVGLTLEVRPQISEGGTIKLDIYQETSSVSKEDKTLGPTTSKRSIRSTVLVDDGEIVALGGLSQDADSAGESKIPLLGDIPWAGSLFRYNKRKRDKVTLVVFLRPVILRDGERHRELSDSRYDYVIGKQRDSDLGRLKLKGEGDVPLLPERAQSGRPQDGRPNESRDNLRDTPAPVFDATFVPAGIMRDMAQ